MAPVRNWPKRRWLSKEQATDPLCDHLVMMVMMMMMMA
jgi:hypothetical protein